MGSSQESSNPPPDKSDPNIVERLRSRMGDARRLGFRVRSEWLDGQQASWCEIAGVRTLFVDLSQPAAEQLATLEDTLESYAVTQGQQHQRAEKAA